MPELPEVETTRRGIAPFLTGARIIRLLARERRLRYPVPEGTEREIEGQRIEAVERRGKYLLLRLTQGTLLIHLGMSGSLRLLPSETAANKHDHVDLQLDGGRCLRLRDPRRFGVFLWTAQTPEAHPLLRSLGPEPFDAHFDGDYLYALARGRRTSVKAFLMDSRVVVGVGNIYANESLYLAGIHPARPCGRVSLPRYRRLAQAVKDVLANAIDQGGTTLRDFVQEDGSPGYFTLSLKVYGHEGESCPACGVPIRRRRIGQRSSYYCPKCQR